MHPFYRDVHVARQESNASPLNSSVFQTKTPSGDRPALPRAAFISNWQRPASNLCSCKTYKIGCPFFTPHNLLFAVCNKNQTIFVAARSKFMYVCVRILARRKFGFRTLRCILVGCNDIWQARSYCVVSCYVVFILLHLFSFALVQIRRFRSYVCII